MTLRRSGNLLQKLFAMLLVVTAIVLPPRSSRADGADLAKYEQMLAPSALNKIRAAAKGLGAAFALEPTAMLPIYAEKKAAEQFPNSTVADFHAAMFLILLTVSNDASKDLNAMLASTKRLEDQKKTLGEAIDSIKHQIEKKGAGPLTSVLAPKIEKTVAPYLGVDYTFGVLVPALPNLETLSPRQLVNLLAQERAYLTAVENALKTDTPLCEDIMKRLVALRAQIAKRSATVEDASVRHLK
jgi:hypothetical protein